MKLAILFDIDGTLLYAKGLGRPAFAEAFEAAYGVAVSFDEVSFVGGTDTDIIRRMAVTYGQTSTPAKEEHFFIELTKRLDQRLSEGEILVYPGVPELLEALCERGFILGVVTGNIRATAWSKLIHSRLAHYFTFGAYACDAEERADIAAIAMRRAHALGAEARLLIGDTPKDIAAAHANGLASLVVETGWVAREALADAECFLPNFSNTAETLTQIETFYDNRT